MLQQSQQGRVMQRKGLGNKIDQWKSGGAGAVDLTICLGDEILLRILSLLPLSPCPYSQVCKRWLRVQGLIRRSIRVLDWRFLESGRMSTRFPKLTNIDLTPACLSAMPRSMNSINVLFTHGCLSVYLNVDAYDPQSIQRFIHDQQLPPATLDKGLKVLADAFPELERLCVLDSHKAAGKIELCTLVIDRPSTVPDLSSDVQVGKKLPSLKHSDCSRNDRNENTVQSDHIEKYDNLGTVKVANQGCLPEKCDTSEHGLSYIACNCRSLQELELHLCSDETLRAISACQNVQILRLVGSVRDFYHCPFTDIGLTILAKSCMRLIKLDLRGCEASYAGVAAIGQCCLMLEELTISNQGFRSGWAAALSLFSSLKTLRLENCKQIDPAPGPLEKLGFCPALEHLQLVCCDLRDTVGFQALMFISANIQGLEIRDCWGLEDETFCAAAACRQLKLLSLDGCSPLTTVGLETVVLAYNELQALIVVCCSNIKDSEISPELTLQFAILKELKWRPDAKSLLSTSLMKGGLS